MYIFEKKSRLELISALIFMIFGLKLRVSTLYKLVYWLKPSVLLLFCSINCLPYIPDPQEDIEKWIKNFEQQRSFSYQHILQTKSVYTKAKGNCVIGRSEHIRGVWLAGDTELTFEYIGMGDIEYIKEQGEWKVVSRGEESDIFTQIERLLIFDKFEYLGSEEGFLYRFKANIPFLAPDKRKEMIGFMKISERNFLPELIWAGLPDSSLYWEAEIYNYNKVKRIKPPSAQWNNYIVITDTLLSRDGCFNAVKKRLDAIKVDYRIKKTDPGIVLSMTKAYGIEDIEAILAPGVVNVYAMAEHRKDASRVGYLEDDITFPLLLKNRLFDHNTIRHAKIKFDAVSQPYIMVQLDKKFTLPAEVALEIDGVIIGTATLDTSKKIDRINIYTIRRYYEMEVLRAILVQTLPNIHIKEIVAEKN